MDLDIRCAALHQLDQHGQISEIACIFHDNLHLIEDLHYVAQEQVRPFVYVTALL